MLLLYFFRYFVLLNYNGIQGRRLHVCNDKPDDHVLMAHKATLFYLLDYITLRSEKLGFVKKKGSEAHW